MIYRLAIPSTILLAAAVCTIPVCAAGQKAQPPTTAPTPKAQLPKITQKMTFQGSCKGNAVDSDGKPVITALTPPADQLALSNRLRAENPNWTLGEGGFIWKRQPISCDSVLIVESDADKGHTAIAFLDGSKKPVLGFEGQIAQQDVVGSFTDVVVTVILLPDGSTRSVQQPGLQGPLCQVFSAKPDSQLHYKDGATLIAKARDMAEVQATWASHIITITCSAGMKNPADGHITNLNVEFNVTPRPDSVYTIPEPHP